MESEILLKHMDQLNLVPENKTRPKMANYVLLSFGSDGGLNQPNGTGREQIIFNGKRLAPWNGTGHPRTGFVRTHRDGYLSRAEDEQIS